MKKGIKILLFAFVLLIFATAFTGYNIYLSGKEPKETGCTTYINDPDFYNPPAGIYTDLKSDEEWDVIAAVASKPGDQPYDKPVIPGACTSLEPNIVESRRNYILVDGQGIPHKVEYFVGRCIKNCSDKEQTPLP